MTQTTNLVSSWIDVSNSITATATGTKPTLTANYINAMNGIVFSNGSNQSLTTGTMPATFTGIKDITCFFVSKVTAVSGLGHLLSSAGVFSSGAIHFMNITPNYNFQVSVAGTTLNDSNTGVAITLNTPFIVMLNVFSTATSTSSYVRLNGVSSATFVHDTTKAVTLNTTAFDFGGSIYYGSARTMSGGLSEIRMYNGTLTLAQIKSVEAYLSTKWGIAVTA